MYFYLYHRSYLLLQTFYNLINRFFLGCPIGTKKQPKFTLSDKDAQAKIINSKSGTAVTSYDYARQSFANEIELIQLASSLELSPPILLADAEQGIIIFPFIEAKPVNLRDKKKLNEVMQLIKKLHENTTILSFQATPEDFICKYLDILQKQNIDLTPLQKQLIDNRPRPILDELVPCHLDLKGDNILDDGKRLWLIDWEYGGMSYPLLDIAQLTPSENFSEEDSMIALSYYDPQATIEMKQKLDQLRILSNMRITLWCLIMSRTSTLDHPYQQWTDELFVEIKNSLNKK